MGRMAPVTHISARTLAPKYRALHHRLAPSVSRYGTYRPAHSYFSTDCDLEHGCHRHRFSKFPDFSLLKGKFPWPNKCKISDMVAASNLQLQQSFAPIWLEILLLAFDGVKSVLQFQFSLTFLQNADFPRPRIKFPEFSLTLKNFCFPWPFPDLWQPCRNTVPYIINSTIGKCIYGTNVLVHTGL